jgi:threonine/homoserine/homoserine lactone efflux protein
MHFQLWPAFVAASAVLLVIPGPTLLTVISFSVANGRRAQRRFNIAGGSILSAAGILALLARRAA